MFVINLIFFAAIAASSWMTSAQQFAELESNFENALLEDAVYDGTVYWGKEGHGTFCDTYDDGQLDFNMVLEDVNVEIDDSGVVDFHVSFQNSMASLYYEVKNGVICRPVHARGEVHLSKLNALIRLVPAEDGPGKDATLRLPKLEIKGLQFKKIYVGSGDHEVGGDLPQWASNWIERNFNWAMAKFLKTEIAGRITDYLIEKLEERLRENPHAGNGQNPTLP